jgi:hypothetical protein
MSGGCLGFRGLVFGWFLVPGKPNPAATGDLGGGQGFGGPLSLVSAAKTLGSGFDGD